MLLVSVDIHIPGCRRPDGSCGFDFTAYGFGCIDPQLVQTATFCANADGGA